MNELRWGILSTADIGRTKVVPAMKRAARTKIVAVGSRDPERLPSQFIVPADGILTLLLDQAAASLLPAPDAQGHGLIERTE